MSSHAQSLDVCITPWDKTPIFGFKCQMPLMYNLIVFTIKTTSNFVVQVQQEYHDENRDKKAVEIQIICQWRTSGWEGGTLSL